VSSVLSRCHLFRNQQDHPETIRFDTPGVQEQLLRADASERLLGREALERLLRGQHFLQKGTEAGEIPATAIEVEDEPALGLAR
jgi:hypothetical protein